MSELIQTYPCPQCRKLIKWSTKNASRPFCSERCRLIDLGEWASEGHRIPGAPLHQDEMSRDEMQRDEMQRDEMLRDENEGDDGERAG